MKKDKLIRLLSCLDKKEFKRFAKYVEYNFGLESIPRKFFLHLKKCYPDFAKHAIEKEFIAAKILQLPEGSNRAKRLSNEAHKLHEALINFLILEKLATDKLQKEQLILDIYRERQLDDLFYLKTAHIRNQIDKKPDSVKKLFDLLRLDHQEFYYAPLRKTHCANTLLPEMLAYLNAFYYTSKKKYLTEMMSRSNLLNESPPIMEQPLHPKLEYWPKHHTELLNKVYDGLLHLTIYRDDPTYDILKKCLLENYQQLAKEDQIIFLMCLLNHASYLVKGDVKRGLNEIFELYKFARPEKLLIESGFISKDNFRNIAYTACGVNQVDWAEQFVREYKHYLVEADKEEITALAEARINLSKNKYEEALGRLENVNFRECSDALLAKMIQVRCYYSLKADYNEKLAPFIHSFERFVKEHKILNVTDKRTHLNFLEILKLIVRPVRKVPPKDILQKLKEKGPTACTSWLEEKIEEM